MGRTIAILASGQGSNAERICSYFSGAEKPVSIHLISDKKSSGIYQIGERWNCPSHYITYPEMSSGALLEKLVSINPDVIVLAGFMRMIPAAVVGHFSGRILNIHPALLPAYGGQGMYGDHVHRAVLQAGESRSGITIHYVNERFDEGPVIAQFHCAISPSDDLGILKSKVQALEHRYYPYVIETILDAS